MPITPTRPKSPPADFSIVSLIRSLCRDAELLPGEGQAELNAVGDTSRLLAKTSTQTMRGHAIPLHRAEAGGLNTGTLASGGAMVSSGSVSLAEALQPVLQLERLGARRVQAQSGDRVVSPPAIISGGWVAEDQDGAAATALFAAALRDPKEAYTQLKMSRRLFKQAGTVGEQEMRLLLQRSVAATIEAGLLAGTGSNSQPMGVVHDRQLQRRTFTGAALPTRARAGELVGELLDNGADLEQVQILASSADFDTSQAGTPLVEVAPDGRRRMATVPVSFSPYVPTGNVVLADWSRVAVAYVGPPQLIVDPYTESESGALLMTLFQQVSYAVERRELLTVATVEA
jgi:hypothetical protein